MTSPFLLSFQEQDVVAWGPGAFKNFCIRDLVLPFDVKKFSEAAHVKVV